MAIPIVSQPPTPLWDEVITFPVLDPSDTLPGAAPGPPTARFVTRSGRTFISTTNTINIGNTNGTGGPAGHSFQSIGGGPPYLQLGSGGAGLQTIGLDVMAAYVDLGSTYALAPGAEWPPLYRTTWLTWLMQGFTANPDQANGLLVMPTNQAGLGVHQWPSRAVGASNAGGFGIVGDGAGQYTYASYDRTGVLLAREVVPLPAHTITDWNKFELVITSGWGNGVNATVDLYMNGTFVLQRDWTGALLEPYAANEWRMLPVMGGGGLAGAGGTNFGGVVCKMGAYTRDGVRIGG